MSGLNFSTRDIMSCRLQLSDELIFSVQQHAGSAYCHIESPSQGRFYRVGYPEYVLLSLLDGHTTLAQAITLSARALGAEALTQPKAAELAYWLLENGLARLEGDPPHVRRALQNLDRDPWSLLRGLNPFWMKIPLLHPERGLASILPLVSWLFSPWMTVLGILLIGAGAAVVAANWDDFLASSRDIFAPHNWLWMTLAWVGLKMVHELGHALVCKRYGGDVRESGLIFILFAPAAYVDVTSSWRFASKWQRIHVAVAGMYVELVLASLASFAWSEAESVVLRHVMFNVVLMASVSTVLFNANPLMRFDGYYILADLLAVPNLATEGARFVRRLAARVFFGTVPPTRDLGGTTGWLVRVYGIAAWFWRLLVCTSLFTAASVLLKGAGLVLGVVGIVGWFGRPIVETAKELVRRYHESPLTALRASIVSLFMIGTLSGLWFWMPWPATVTVPVVVDYANLSIVRSRADGFIDKIHVHDGMAVEAGDLLLDLKNDELETELLELRSAAYQADLQHRAAVSEHDAAKDQVALCNRKAVQDRIDELEQQRKGLRVFAPVAGRVVARDLDNRIGVYVEEGDELLAVGDEHRKELLCSISQQQMEEVTPRLGETVRFRTGPLRAYAGALSRLDPRASQKLPHVSLSASVGGPLAVREAPSTDNAKEPQLVESRFTGIISIPPDTAAQLACGDRGYALLGFGRRSVGQHIRHRVLNWLRNLAKLRQQ